MKNLKELIIEKLKIDKNTKLKKNVLKDWQYNLIKNIDKIFDNNKAYSTKIKKIIDEFIITDNYKSITNSEYVIIAHDYYESTFCKEYNCEDCIYKFLDDKNFQEFCKYFDDLQSDDHEREDNDNCNIVIAIKEGYLSITGSLTLTYEVNSYINIMLVPKFEVD